MTANWWTTLRGPVRETVNQQLHGLLPPIERERMAPESETIVITIRTNSIVIQPVVIYEEVP